MRSKLSKRWRFARLSRESLERVRWARSGPSFSLKVPAVIFHVKSRRLFWIEGLVSAFDIGKVGLDGSARDTTIGAIRANSTRQSLRSPRSANVPYHLHRRDRLTKTMCRPANVGHRWGDCLAAFQSSFSYLGRPRSRYFQCLVLVINRMCTCRRSSRRDGEGRKSNSAWLIHLHRLREGVAHT